MSRLAILLFARLLLVLNSLGTVWIFLLMLVIVTDVVGRTAFTRPLPGVPELVSLSIVGIVFLQLPHTLRAGRITRVDSLKDLLARRVPRMGHAVQTVYSLLGAVLFAALFAALLPMFLSAYANQDYVGVQGYITYPVWPVRLIMLAGSASCVLQYLLLAVEEGRQALGRQPLLELAGRPGSAT